MSDFWAGKKVVVTGGGGFLGRHIVALLDKLGARAFVPRSRDYDLTTKLGLRSMLDASNEPDMIIHAAATCGGIGLNRAHPYLLCYENLIMGTRLIHLSMEREIPKFVCIGTVCSYPRWARVPFREEALWDGYPEETNAPYGLAKKMLLVLLQAARAEFGYNGIFIIPTNMYGVGDNFDPETSHVIPALIRKFVVAKALEDKEVVLWGTGKPSRDFLCVEDGAAGIVLAAEKWNRPEPLNLGTGREVRIGTLAHFIQEIVGYEGKIVWDTAMPDGQPARSVSASRIETALGWEPIVDLQEGLRRTVEWFLENR